MIIRKDLHSALRRAAFTLMEILIVVAIIVALAGVGGVYLFGVLNNSKEQTAKIQCKELQKACEIYVLRWQGAKAPATMADLLDENTPSGAVLKDGRAATDPWGQPYEIRQGAKGPVVVSQGPPGAGRMISSEDP